MKKAETTPDTAYIFLVGGPRGRANFSLTSIFSTTQIDSLKSSFLTASATPTGAAVFAPDYLGTTLRSKFPGVDLPYSADEIIELVNSISASRKFKRVVLVSHSAGGYLGLEVLQRIAIPTIAIGPLIPSFEQVLVDPAGTDLPPNAAQNPVKVGVTGPGMMEIKMVSTSVEKNLRSFAGDKFPKSLPQMLLHLPPSRRKCLTLVFGDQDQRVGLAGLSKLRQSVPDVRVRIVKGIGHNLANSEQMGRMASVIESSISSRCIRRKAV